MKAELNARRTAIKLRRQMTNAEIILWSRLKGQQFQGLHFRKQHPAGPFIADFACVQLRLLIEVDGDTHSKPNEIEYDRQREAYLKQNGWTVFRVWNNDIYKNLSGVLDALQEQVRFLEQVRK